MPPLTVLVFVLAHTYWYNIAESRPAARAQRRPHRLPWHGPTEEQWGRGLAARENLRPWQQRLRRLWATTAHWRSLALPACLSLRFRPSLPLLLCVRHREQGEAEAEKTTGQGSSMVV
jgi:hypothetical protein